MTQKCKITIGEHDIEGIFMGVFQYSDVMPPSPMVGGHTGGVVAYPVAVVRTGNTFRRVPLKNVTMVTEPSELSTEDALKQNRQYWNTRGEMVK